MAMWVSIATLVMMVLSSLSLVTGAASASPLSAPLGGSASAPQLQVPGVTSSSLGIGAPTFAGPAATGCNLPGCSLLSGPLGPISLSTASPTATRLASAIGKSGLGDIYAGTDANTVTPQQAAAAAGQSQVPLAGFVSSISCQPLGPGCDIISSSTGGATGVKGLNAVSSASLYNEDVEPADQGLCAGNGYAVEANNLGEIQIFSSSLATSSPPIALDTLMGLTGIGWSSGGDPSCLFDYSNGGHWFITEIVSSTPESIGGTFAGCFAAIAFGCYEGIAVSTGPSPFGPYNVYFLNANYNPYEPGFPYQLNDFAKIATTRDAFLVFYDEFPLLGGGFGGGFFNGAQQFAFDKNAMEMGLPTLLKNGMPNPRFNVAFQNMGLLATPNGICPSDNVFHLPGITCWYAVIPAQSPDPTQFDNSHGGSGFMMESLDFYGAGDNRIAVFDWQGLSNLNSWACHTCNGLKFGGQLFSGVEPYFEPGIIAPQKAGAIPLGSECGAAGLTNPTVLPSCPEQGIATNGDDFTQASYANGHIYGALSTEVNQTFQKGPGCPCIEAHVGVAYYVVATDSFNARGVFTLTNEAYVTAIHEELEFPTIAAEGTMTQDGGNGAALITFSLSGNGGPTGAHNGGYYPSTAYGWITPTSNGLLGSRMNIADKGMGPQDGFTEYLGLPGGTRPRWGDYSAAIFVPFSGGKVYFATNYIQFASCTGAGFTLTIGTCHGTRDGFANWGTSVNFAL